MKFIYSTLNWVFGVLFLLSGLVMTTNSLIVALLLIVISLMLLPPIRKFIYQKTQKELPIKLKASIITILFISVLIMSSKHQNEQITIEKQKQAQLETQKKLERQEKVISDFKNNKEAIINSLKLKLENKQYEEVINESKKYFIVKDKELNNIAQKAKDELLALNEAKKIELAKAQKEEQTNKLLNQLSTLKENNYKENTEIYKKLTHLYPNNEEYKTKLAFFDKKYRANLREEQAKAQKEKEDRRLTQLGLKWQYDTNKDKMGRGDIKYALVGSLNTLNFAFPYQGEQRATLQLRKHPKHGKDVILSIKKGQFLCNNYNGCKVAVKFDNNKVKNYSAIGASDHDSTVLFIKNYKSFVLKAKKSKKIYIEAEFFREGSRVLEFNTEGLKF